MAATTVSKKAAKEVLYLEVPAELKERIKNLADKHKRKITAEAVIALEEYADREEAKDTDE